MGIQLFGIRDPHKINIGTNDELQLEGFLPSTKRKIISIVLCVLSLGVLGIFFLWKPSFYLRMSHVTCHVKDATVILVTDSYGQYSIEQVNRTSTLSGTTIWFVHKKRKYIWKHAIATFIHPVFPGPEMTIKELYPSSSSYMTNFDVRERRELFGENKLDIELNTLWTMFLHQARSPLFLSPVVCICILVLKLMFIPKSAVVFGTVVTLIGVIGLYIGAVSILIQETYQHSKALKERMISESIHKVMRDRQVVTVRTSELVPGDLVYMNSCSLVEADLLLIDGSVVVNEGLLTGESIPVTKVCVNSNDEIFCEDLHKNNILYCGTRILELKGGSELRAVVLKTGFETVKGEMVRNILFPRPTKFQLYTDYLLLISVFLCIGLIVFLWSVIHWSISELTDWRGVLFRSLDVLTFVVPPILPATITANNLWSQKRLAKLSIECSSSGSISLAGTIDVVCFDKTGTLTENDLSVETVLPVDAKSFSTPLDSLSHLQETNLLASAIASCHSLTLDEEKRPVGYHIDLKMFQELNWTLVPLEDPSYNYYEMCPMALVRPSQESLASPNEIGVLKIFPFDAKEQRMTVVTKKKGGEMFDVFIKGAPETILSLCADDTVPDDCQTVLKAHGSQGLRIIAVAHSTLPPRLLWKDIDSMSRTELEHKPTLLGFVLFQNKLKQESISTISTLRKANLTTVMLTGDNIWTAISVSRKCGIVKDDQIIILVTAKLIASSSAAAQHVKIEYTTVYNEQEKSKSGKDFVLAVDGESFSLLALYGKETFRRLLVRGRIFARMKPQQKVEVIEQLQSLGYLVAMCGDGCNDCGAMKAANVGISVSTSVASAAAPFTSTTGNTESVIGLLKEGRANLTSTCASFKYNIAYCFTSLIGIIFLFSIYTEYTDVQYLIMGLLLISIPCIAFGLTEPTKTLERNKPLKRILHPLHITSIGNFLLMHLFLFLILWNFTQKQVWYTPSNSTGPLYPINPSYEGTVIVGALYLSCIAAAAIFSHGRPHCKPIYRNRILSAYLVLGFVFYLICTFVNSEGFTSFMKFLHAPSLGFIFTIVMFTMFWELLCFVWEKWVLYGSVGEKAMLLFQDLFHSYHEYEKIEEGLSLLPTWPETNKNHLYKEGALEEYEPLTFGDDRSENEFCKKLSTRHKFDRDQVVYMNEGTSGASGAVFSASTFANTRKSLSDESSSELGENETSDTESRKE